MGEQYEERVAFVTDGWFALGGVITDSLLADGLAVGVGFNRADPALDYFSAKRADRPVSLHQGSLAEPRDCHRAIDELVAKRGRLDVLVAMLNFRAAGMLSTRRSLRRLSAREWQRTLDVHLSGAFHITQAALEHMRPAGSGRIIFVVGTAGVGDGQGHHAMIRDGIRALTRELARELAGTGITVNRVTTGLINDEVLGMLPPGALEEATARLPLGRLPEPSEITRVVHFLAHQDSGYLTGQLLAVDGGLTLDSM